MTFISALKELWRRKLLVMLAIVIACAVAVAAVYQVSLSPPSLTKRSSAEAHGKTEILVDSARSPIAGSKRDLSGLIVRAGVLARLMSGGDVVAQIGRQAGISPNLIEVAGATPIPGEAPGITEGPKVLPYGLSITEVPELPVVFVQTRAPSLEDAQALAAAAPKVLRRVITSVQHRQDTPATERVEVRVLGPAQARLTDEGPGAKIGAAIFAVVLALEIGLILGFPRLLVAWRRDEEAEAAALATAPDVSEPSPTLVLPHGNGAHNDGGRVRQRQR